MIMLKSGDKLENRYQVEKQIGEGRYAKVFEVFDCQDKKKKVIKILKLEDFPNLTQEHIKTLFKQEVEVLKKLKHPGIPRVDFDGYFTSEKSDNFNTIHCLVMEKIEGINLENWMLNRKEKPINQEQAIIWLEQLLKILLYLHKNKYFHQDISSSNIIVKADKTLVLIDFGSVKKLTNLQQNNNSNSIFREQNEEQKFIKLDLSSLGCIFVYLLTGKKSIEFSVRETWREKTQDCCKQLANIIDYLISNSLDEKPNTEVVIKRLTEIKKEISPRRKVVLFYHKWLFPFLLKWNGIPASILISVIIAVLVIAMRSFGLLQGGELQAYDQLMRLRPDEKQDSRLLVITVDEEDFKYQEKMGWEPKGSLSDVALSQLLAKLEPHEPRVIGLDIYRDFKVRKDQVQLASQLKNPNFFAVCKISDSSTDKAGVKPPPEVAKEQLGFSDVVIDDDKILRRYIWYMNADEGCATENSFALQLALHYLVVGKRIQPKLNSDILQLGNAILKSLNSGLNDYRPITEEKHKSSRFLNFLNSGTGGYQKLDDRGYQMLINYRSRQIAHTVSLRSILDNQYNLNLIKDKIVLIGVTEPSYRDFFSTPYSVNQEPDPTMSGVLIQAQVVSQIISAALDNRPLLDVWNRGNEAIWIIGWSLVGGVLAWRIRTLLILVPATVVGIGGLFIICIILFNCGYWVPLVPAVIGSIFSVGFVAVYLRSQY